MITAGIDMGSRTIKVVFLVQVDPGKPLKAQYDGALKAIDALIGRLRQPVPLPQAQTTRSLRFSFGRSVRSLI